MLTGLLTIGLVGPVIAATILGPYRIEANSMAPNVVDGDLVFLDPTFARQPFTDFGERHDPERGDLVMFEPREADAPYIKRVIGLPGDEVRLIDGVVQLNGEPLSLEPSASPLLNEVEERASRLTETLPSGVSYDVLDISSFMVGDDTQTFVVPEDHYFVLGDNRDASLDSRSDRIGFVPRDAIIGRAWTLF